MVNFIHNAMAEFICACTKFTIYQYNMGTPHNALKLLKQDNDCLVTKSV